MILWTHVTSQKGEQSLASLRGSWNSYRLIFNLFREMSRVANNGLFKTKLKASSSSQTNFKYINAGLVLDNRLQFSSWISKNFCLEMLEINFSSTFQKRISNSKNHLYKLRIIHSKNVFMWVCIINHSKFNFRSLQTLALNLKNEFNCSNIILQSH